VLELTDTHCHLDFDSFDEDRDEIISRARQVGIRFILNPGIDVQSSRKALRLSERYEEVFIACGIHPNDATSWNDNTINELRLLARGAKVRAIGEIGLDYYRDRAPRELQKQIFLKQLALAGELCLPVIIHSRDAMRDILELLSGWQRNLLESGSPLAARPGVLHSFSGNREDLDKAIAINFYVGVSGPVTYQKAEDLRLTLAHVPMTSLLIETDAPFLTPHPHRGRRNEPAYVRFTAEKIAQIHDLPIEAIVEQTTKNSKSLFLW
jgi:TatD DNase family protein